MALMEVFVVLNAVTESAQLCLCDQIRMCVKGLVVLGTGMVTE